MYDDSGSNLSSCPSGAAIPAFLSANARHLRSASNYGSARVPGLLPLLILNTAALSVNNAPSQTIIAKVVSGRPDIHFPLLHFAPCFPGVDDRIDLEFAHGLAGRRRVKSASCIRRRELRSVTLVPSLVAMDRSISTN